MSYKRRKKGSGAIKISISLSYAAEEKLRHLSMLHELSLSAVVDKLIMDSTARLTK